ncbi:MAG: DUF2142 domain-containing protein [Desulfobacterales bacterium]
MYSATEHFRKKRKYLLLAIVLHTAFLLYFITGTYYHVEKYDYGESKPLVPITEDVTIKQEFIPDSNRMIGFEIQFATYGRVNNSNVHVKLTDAETDNVLFEQTVAAADMRDNQYRKFEFSEIPDSADKKYIISIVSDAAPENAITVWTGNGQYENTQLFLGNAHIFSTLNFTVYYAGTKKFAVFLYVSAGILTLLAIILTGNSTVRNFAVLSAIFGSYFCIVTPFYHPLDEIAHFYRAYDVAQGNLFLDSQNGQAGSWLPVDINKIQHERRFDEAMKTTVRINCESNREFISSYIKYTSQYCFLSYIPAAMGIFIGKIFCADVDMTAYLARLTNLFCYILLVTLSIKTIPKGKNLVMALALIPFQLLLSASISLDGILLASILLFISVCFRLHGSHSPVQNRDITVLILLLTIITATKSIAYAPLFLLFFIITPSKFKNRRTYFLSLGAGILSVLLLMLIMKIFSPVLATTDDRAAGANAREQIRFIIQHPLTFLYAVANTFHLQLNTNFSALQHPHFFGKDIGNISTFLLPVFLFWLAKTDCAGTGSDGAEINRFLIAFILISNIFLIHLAMYIYFSPVGSMIANGVQGRYYIPLIAVLLLAVNKNSGLVSENAGLAFTSTYALILILNYNSLLLVRSMY